MLDLGAGQEEAWAKRAEGETLVGLKMANAGSEEPHVLNLALVRQPTVLTPAFVRAEAHPRVWKVWRRFLFASAWRRTKMKHQL